MFESGVKSSIQIGHEVCSYLIDHSSNAKFLIVKFMTHFEIAAFLLGAIHPQYFNIQITKKINTNQPIKMSSTFIQNYLLNKLFQK